MAQILIIDDDPTTRMVLKRSLERQGHSVGVGCDGSEGIALAQHLQPALIICDWMMPYFDGLEVCRQLKAQAEFSTTFFILLTSRAEIADRVKGLDAGADEFLSKPIDPNELQARVRAGLRLHQLSRDLQIQTQHLEAELAEAERYVRSQLPLPAEFEAARIRTDWRFLPSQQLGGDGFDYRWLDDQQLVIYLLDVSGHGVGASLLSIAVMNLLRSPSLPGADFSRPDTVLHALNRRFQMVNHNEMYFTIWYGVYNTHQRKLTYASAGHPPALLVQPSTSTVMPLRTPNLPIGMLPGAEFLSSELTLSDPADLYLFSDGVYEISPDHTSEIWGLEALSTCLALPLPSGLNRLDHVLKSSQEFGQRPTFLDDFSLLQIQFR